MMVVTWTWTKNLPSQQQALFVFINVIPGIIDVDVVNGYHHLWGGGGGGNHLSPASSMIIIQAMCLQWLYVLHISQIENFSLTHNSSLQCVLRIHALQCHERKLCLHDVTVTVELDKLLETPPSGEPLDDRIEEIH